MYTCKHNNRGKRNSNWIFMKTLTSFSTSYIIRIIIMHFYLFSIETYEVCLAEQKQEFRKKDYHFKGTIRFLFIISLTRGSFDSRQWTYLIKQIINNLFLCKLEVIVSQQNWPSQPCQINTSTWCYQIL